MTTLFASNNIAHWSGAFTADTAVSGAYDSTRVPYYLRTVDDVNNNLVAPHPAPASTTVWYHFRLYAGGIAPGASEDGWLATISDIDGKFIMRLDMSNGTMGNSISGDGTTFTTGTFATGLSAAITEIDIKTDVVAGTVTTELYVNQILHVSGTRAVTNTGTIGVARNFSFDFTDAGFGDGGVFFAVSEFLVSDTDTRNARVNLLQPTTAGNYTAWGGDVATLSDDDGATGMTSGTANQRQSANIGTYAGGATIASVIAVSRITRGSGSPANAKQFLRKSSVDYDGTSVAVPLDNTGFIVEEWTTDPSDALAWTAADLSGLEVGVQSLT